MKPEKFVGIRFVQLQHFSVASKFGYGQCTYLRLEDGEGNVYCSLVIGKSRVAPLKSITVPLLELTAALLSVKDSALLVPEIEYYNVT